MPTRCVDPCLDIHCLIYLKTVSHFFDVPVFFVEFLLQGAWQLSD